MMTYRFKYTLLLIAIATILFTGCRDEVDPTIANTTFGMLSLVFEFIIAVLVIIGGYALIIGGIVFIILGLSGNIELVVETTGFTSRLLNASPGAFMVFLGVLLIWLRGKIDIKAIKHNDTSDESE